MQIPSWLRMPPNAGPRVLPVQTNLQLLPFIELTWEHFEQLCLRLVEEHADAEYCQLYGVRGQDQEGIDLFARNKSNGKYAVYQCKRLDKLRASDISKATTRFLKDKWSKKSDEFVFCTSHDTSEKKIADEIVKQQRKLSKKGIVFVVWQQSSLSSRLKKRPDLVDDFFGRPFVSAFCGKEVAESLSNRLDVHRIAEYRKKLKQFYHHIFLSHDPALPIRRELGLGRVELADRYVVPDLRIRISSGPILSQKTDPTPEDFKADPDLEKMGGAPTARVRFAAPSHVTTRAKLDNWLSQAGRSVILGGPGSGKSALLRFLILDILSDNPTLALTLSRWATAIPVGSHFHIGPSLFRRKTQIGVR